MSDMLNDIPDDELRKKLQNYSESPDEDLWKRVASGVKDSMPLSERLRTFEEVPDDIAWSNIATGVRIERSMLWMERLGKFAAVVSILLLIFPWINQISIDQHTSELASSELASREGSESAASSEAETSATRSTEQAQQGYLKPNDKSTEQSSATELRAADQSEGGVGEKELSDTGRQLNAAHEVENAANEETTINTEKSSTSIVGITGEKKVTEESIVLNEGKTSNSAVAVSNEMPHVAQPEKQSVDTTQQEAVVKKVAAGEQKSIKPEEDKKKNRRQHGMVYALVMPTFGYQQIKPVKDDDLFIESIEKVSAFSPKRLGIRAEVGFERTLKNKLSYNIGLLYFQRNQTINYIFRDASLVNIELQNEDSMLYKVNMPQDSATFEYELKNVGLVVGLNYTTKAKRFIHKIGIAAELQRSLVNVNKEVDTGQRYFLFGDVYYRLSYPISRRFEVMFQPTFNYALQLDSEINAPFYVKPYGLGLNFGGSFRF